MRRTRRASVPWLVAAALATADVAAGSSGAGVDLVVTADKDRYRPGEPIAVTLQIVNRGPHVVALQFPTAQRYDVLVKDAQGRDVWRWSADQMVAQVVGTETLRPGGRPLTYRVVVREYFPAGRYAIIGVVPAAPGPISAAIDIRIE